MSPGEVCLTADRLLPEGRVRYALLLGGAWRAPGLTALTDGRR